MRTKTPDPTIAHNDHDRRLQGHREELVGDATVDDHCDPLVDAVEQALRLSGRNTQDMFAFTGIQPAYWALVKAGKREPASLGEVKLRCLAECIGVPYLQVMLLADIISITDCVATENLDEMFERFLVFMRLDPQFVGFIPKPAEIEKMSKETKALFVLMYEQMSGKSLLKKTLAIHL